MPSPAELIALTLAAATPAQDAPPTGEGPRASSNEGERYDAVGYAGSIEAPAGVAHATLPPGSFVEVTALDTGKTALFAVTEGMQPRAGEVVALSAIAMQQLGIASADAPVRVRAGRPSPPEIAALRAGQPASARLDAPAVLLVGLRKELPSRAAPAVSRSAPSPTAAAKPRPARGAPMAVPAAAGQASTQSVRRPAQRPIDPPEKQVAVQPKPQTAPARGWGVQVAALSNAANARKLAGQLGGRVREGGGLYRVQLGPFADRNAADRARTDLARRGHGGAALVQIP
ncbi:SPOR domain-containing protein [Sphingomonas sp. Y38-1Y]|uniref:SPOR domain-containing protein n=1 Tax=Sphingomonas sp. Y38-1Y TaxID=3078265 RepID=UPI0028EF1B46|nr:SPOR domain-containing protein [Sphingomonas sp. Y38-1Y]